MKVNKFSMYKFSPSIVNEKYHLLGTHVSCHQYHQPIIAHDYWLDWLWKQQLIYIYLRLNLWDDQP